MKKLCWLALALLLVPALVYAHGATPLPTDLHGVGDSQWVLRTNFGLVTSDAPDSYVCEEAFAGGDDFQVGVLGVNEWLIFTRAAVIYSPDGCDFEIRQQIPKKPAGIAVSPDRSRAAYLINVDDAAESGVWWSDDAGQTVTQANLDASMLELTRVKFLDNGRLLVSAYSSEDGNRGPARLIEVNLDDDTTRQLAGLDGVNYPYIFDVENDWVVWLGRDADAQTIYWGPIDEPIRYSTGVDSWPSGARLSDDGQLVWISGVQEGARGVMVGDTSDESVWSDRFVDHSALCIGRVGQAYHLCARRDREGHDLARVGADGSLEPVVNFSNLVGTRDDCPAGSDVASTCASVWPELAPALGIEVEESTDAGHSHEHGDHDHADDEHGCSTGGGSPSALLIMVGVVLVFWRRRS
jgi:MYXO-CTERM domain-containing protein